MRFMKVLLISKACQTILAKKKYDICKLQLFKKIVISRKILNTRWLYLGCIRHFQVRPRLVFSQFFDLRENLRMLKKNRLGKLVSPVKRSPQFHTFTKQSFAWRRFFLKSTESLLYFLEKQMLKRGGYLNRFNYKNFIKSFIKAL